MSSLTSIDQLKKLISFDTTSSKTNLDLIGYIADFLYGHGIVSELSYDDTGKKANLFATIAGPKDKQGIVFSGHTDVVPVTDQNWTKNPYLLTEQDDKLYGRGSADMKGFIAICLALTEQIKQTSLKQPIHFAFSYDEEVGCIGVRKLIVQLEKREIKPAACIIGEPTSLQAINAHKGKISQRCEVSGHACHSSRTDEGVNAVEYAAEIITYLRRLGERIEQDGPFDDGFLPTYTSVHTGPIKGGTILNIVPDQCSFDFEFRNIPGHDAEKLLNEVKSFAKKELLPKMQRKQLKANIEWHSISLIPAFNQSPESELIQLCLKLSPIKDTGKVSFGTEAGIFQQLGMQAIVCGPGSINQAHKADEFIELEQLYRGEKFLKDILQHISV